MKIFISENNRMVENMFRNNGHKIMATALSADVIVFTGGADISPLYYFEQRLPLTQTDHERDKRDAALWAVWKKDKNKKFVGICRGAQFLNVMCQGALWQHVENHRQSHQITDLYIEQGRKFPVTSTHHQMMIPNERRGIVLAIAEVGKDFRSAKGREQPKYDTEVVWYPEDKCLCFQPHPEYSQKTNYTEKYFFDLFKRLIEGKS